ncbi:Protein kinase domain and Serine/threonine-/dual specificity protein kinase, catalytic domain and Protein kinase-like domain-containing protein [Strongyloides ratti]|uniref:Protein kinase domain and Serine/threonine-/dual specificity protein kinase, catalytic domain and Protein kinase-like domain-containing protein n=1 Tax=Strongyloides ratti TaxID=34506 RepID=A0A090LLR0_STRRB|nr:Protein kinase domain and Serine/threonine-/dual specificity protein kinase, catalytic domain and Protein kinase-like domain-containing protein [Strongyloides ratti]CEF68495.1 Protein kinase domain and Serine/threonine-/dual specificity protein kinase, catalytic domain and Protein kinase-like domain-containing protein [Strongyloides ratti]
MVNIPFVIGKIVEGVDSTTVTVKKLLKQGKFSAIYQCEKNFDTYSLKVSFEESCDVELDVINNVDYKCAYGRKIVQMFDVGFSNTLDQTFFVYEIFHRNLTDYINKKQSYRLGALEGLYTLTEYLSALEYLHNRGFVYRNVKPSSLCIENKDGTIFGKRLYLWELECCYRIDYSSLNDQKYINKMKNIYENRKEKLINCAKYCSIKEHTSPLPKIINDIESWYYTGIKVFEGTLPWSSIKNNDEQLIINKKKELNDIFNNFFIHTPILFTTIMKLITQNNGNNFNYIETYKILKRNMLQIDKNDISIMSDDEKLLYNSVLLKRKEILLPTTNDDKINRECSGSRSISNSVSNELISIKTEGSNVNIIKPPIKDKNFVYNLKEFFKRKPSKRR